MGTCGAGTVLGTFQVNICIEFEKYDFELHTIITMPGEVRNDVSLHKISFWKVSDEKNPLP